MPVDPDALVDAAGIAARFHLSLPTVRSWAQRGFVIDGEREVLERRGTDPAGRALYRYADVMRFVSAARRRARPLIVNGRGEVCVEYREMARRDPLAQAIEQVVSRIPEDVTQEEFDAMLAAADEQPSTSA